MVVVWCMCFVTAVRMLSVTGGEAAVVWKKNPWQTTPQRTTTQRRQVMRRGGFGRRPKHRSLGPFPSPFATARTKTQHNVCVASETCFQARFYLGARPGAVLGRGGPHVKTKDPTYLRRELASPCCLAKSHPIETKPLLVLGARGLARRLKKAAGRDVFCVLSSCTSQKSGVSRCNCTILDSLNA
jgi:hypothetical protein